MDIKDKDERDAQASPGSADIDFRVYTQPGVAKVT